MNILIRDVSDVLLAKIDAAATADGISRQELLTRLLDATYGEPPVVVGWFKADRPGELDSEVDCPECGQSLKEVWLGFMSNGQWRGPVCQWCATSE